MPLNSHTVTGSLCKLWITVCARTMAQRTVGAFTQDFMNYIYRSNFFFFFCSNLDQTISSFEKRPKIPAEMVIIITAVCCCNTGLCASFCKLKI